MKSVWLIGRDYINWSIDQDHLNFKKVLKEEGHSSPFPQFFANTFLIVWWSQAISMRYRILKKIFPNKSWIGILTDDLEHQKEQFLKCKEVIDFWVYANTKQKKFLQNQNILEDHMFYCPYYVDEETFRDLGKTKEELCRLLNIPYERIGGKFLIGSFQRDSLGIDLTKQKWQKNPELLINVLKGINKEKYLLVLAGPRRHYIINKCVQNKIPYLFIGDDSLIKGGKDDIKENTLGLNKIALLYNLIDLYVVTSKSEGGPKAVIEAPISKKPIFSTPVGMAPDLLIEESLCSSRTEFINKIEKLIKDTNFRKKIIDGNYWKVSKINNWKSFKKRVEEIICKAKK